MFRDVLMPIFILLAMAALLVGIVFLADDGSVDGGLGYSTTCLNGVKYYEGYRRLTPAVDAETLTFIRCEGK